MGDRSQHLDLLWQIEGLPPEQARALLQLRLVQLEKLRVDTENKMAVCHTLINELKEGTDT